MSYGIRKIGGKSVRIPIRLSAQGKDHSKSNTAERKSSALHVEPMVAFEDDGEGLESEVDYSEDEG